MDDKRYFQLEQYIKGANVADFFYRLRKPVWWLRVVAGGALGAAIVAKNVYVIFAAAAVLVFSDMGQGKKLLDAFRTDGPPAENVRPRVRKLIRQGRLDAVIGADVAAALERCAEVARRTLSTMAIASFSKKGASEDVRKISKAVGDAMDGAIRLVWKSVFFKLPPEPGIEAEIAKIHDDLERLYSLVDEPKSLETPRPALDEVLKSLEERRKAEEELRQSAKMPEL